MQVEPSPSAGETSAVAGGAPASSTGDQRTANMEQPAKLATTAFSPLATKFDIFRQ